MDIPECRSLKTKYDDCYNNWMKNMKRVEPIQCDDSFQDYKDCVIVAMQSKYTKPSAGTK